MVKLIKNRKKKSLLRRLKQRISRHGGESEISYQKKHYPFITNEMITPLEKPLTTRNALKIYKQHMLAIDYLEKSEVADFITSLKGEFDDHERYLKEELTSAKEALADAKAEVKPEMKKLKRERARSKDEDEKADLNRDLEEAEEQVRSAQEEFDAITEQLNRFRRDKREFLIDYINTEVHGPGWKSQ